MPKQGSCLSVMRTNLSSGSDVVKSGTNWWHVKCRAIAAGDESRDER